VSDHGGNNVVDVAREEEDAGDDDGCHAVMLENSFSSAWCRCCRRSRWSPHDIHVRCIMRRAQRAT